jgi:integrase
VALTREEFDRLLAVIPDAEFRLLLRVMYFTGCRPGEAYKLKPRHLHPLENKATLTHKEHKTGHWTGKKRLIYFPASIMKEVRQLAAQRGSDEPILRNTKGRPWNDSNVGWRFRRAIKRAGLPSHLVPYATRHSFGTSLVESGESTPLVAKAMGHANDRTLQQHYYHAREQRMADMVEQRAEGKEQSDEKAALMSIIETLQEEIKQLKEKLADQEQTRELLMLLRAQADKLGLPG